MKLKVNIGSDPGHTQIAWVNHEGRPTEVDGPFWVGRILVRVRDFDGITPDGSPPKSDSIYFRGRSRKFQIQAEGRFKKEYNGNQVIFGTQFDHMISTFPESAFRAGMRIAKYIDPAVYYDKFAKSPYIMSPFVACVNTLSAWPAPSRLDDAVISLVEADPQESDTDSLPDMSESLDDDLQPSISTPNKSPVGKSSSTRTPPPPIKITATQSPSPHTNVPSGTDHDNLSIVSSDSGNTTADPNRNRHRYWSFAGFNDNTRFSHLNSASHTPETSTSRNKQRVETDPSLVDSIGSSLIRVSGEDADNDDDELILHRPITNRHKDFSRHVQQLGLLHKPSLDGDGYVNEFYDNNSFDDENEEDLQRYFTALEMQSDKKHYRKSKNKDPFHRITHPNLHIGKISTPKIIKRMSLRSKKGLKSLNPESSSQTEAQRTSTSSMSPPPVSKNEKKMSAPRRSLDKLIRIGSLHRHHHHHHHNQGPGSKPDQVESDSGFDLYKSESKHHPELLLQRNSMSTDRPSSSQSTLTSPDDSLSNPKVSGETGSLPPLREDTSPGESNGITSNPDHKEEPDKPGKNMGTPSLDISSHNPSNDDSNKKPGEVDNHLTVPTKLAKPSPSRTQSSQSKIPKPCVHIPSESNSLDPQLGPFRFANPKVDPIEDNSFIFGEHKSVKDRRKYFSSSTDTRADFYYDKDVVYCMSFFSPHMDFNRFNLNIGPIKLNVYRHLNSDGHQPIRYMMRETEDEHAIMFVVEFDLVEEDDEAVLLEQANERERRKH
ncbi:DUF1769 family protein [Schizosaccharomyces cryophilus OY26]|uniref:DUF1769 family protein n=1 Tax=Schizosaccharomyces cryophilus (strain OY26 / ATCC MYA-4695 / CBS 11777 / NBRC 106824 / NRRL Y48691) TaxID=653667 RepID=S9VUZ4_SCHCR|nr:DUF1769 family protein [Schizosaccharomyces cryophilus OY26]EPY50004.1 DUF1769 family protein [Schizosaccharomyces cryophilus OY26]